MSAPPTARCRTVFAAAHVVMTEAYRTNRESVALLDGVDWDATRGVRRSLDALGFGIAEAMDTAQRFEIGWPLARRLIEECGALNLEHGFVAGAGYDQREAIASLAELIDAVAEQARFIASHGGTPVILPMPWLTEHDCAPADYVRVYSAIADAIEGHAIVHWLGEVFLASMRGYFPGSSFFDVMAARPETYVGAKLSLLDADFEHEARRRLRPTGQVILTGDDWHFGELILGGDGTTIPEVEEWSELNGRPLALGDFSHALLGVFGAVARPASRALDALQAGRLDEYRATMSACEELGRLLFTDPVPAYKAGVALLTWLDGRAPRFALPFGAEGARSRDALAETVRRAAALGLLPDARSALERLGSPLATCERDEA